METVVEAAGVEPASESDPHEASTCLAASMVLSPPALRCSRRMGGQSPESRLPSEDGRGKPAGYAASSRSATGGAGLRTWRVFKPPVLADCCQLCFCHLFIEVDGTSACCPGFNTPVEAVSPPGNRS